MSQSATFIRVDMKIKMMFKEIVDINKKQHVALEEKQASGEEKVGQGQQLEEYQYLKGTEGERR